MNFDSFFEEHVKIASRLSNKYKLREHQEEAIQFVQESGGRALLAHPTGSGKTLSGIAAAEALRGKKGKTLVVLPAALKDNFATQGVKKFVPKASVGEVDGKSDYQLVSYAKMRKDPEKVLRESKATTVLADEVHRAKDPSSATHRALKHLSHAAQNFIGLTGSIISNHPKDLVPLMDITHPRHELGSRAAFSKKHVKKEQVGGGFLRPGRIRAALKNKPRLSKNVAPSVSFLEHSDLGADLPRLEISEVRVPMSKEQERAYRYALGRVPKTYLSMIQRGEPITQNQATHIFGHISNARQAANSIGSVFDIKPAEAAERTPKLKQVMDDVEAHLKDNKDGQAVVFTHFNNAGAAPLVSGLRSRGHEVGVFSGTGTLGTTTKSRIRDIEDFKKRKKRIMVLTPAANEGVSLDNATAFFEVDRHYNPEKNQQAIARARRIGGQAHRKPEDRKVEVKRYYSEPPETFWSKVFGSKEVGIDEWIGRVAEEKDRLNADLRSTIRRKK